MVLAAGGVDVAHGDDLHVVARQQVTDVAVHLLAHADAADVEALGGSSRLGPHAARQDERRGEQSGSLEETTAGEVGGFHG